MNSRVGRGGVIAGVAAFAWWGFFPLYFRLLPGVRPVEVLANRIVWSLIIMVGILAALGRFAWLGPALRHPRTLVTFVATSALLSANWITYIWAVSHGQVVDASLGYFMTPLVNVALGFAVLGERPRRPQWIALAIAALGVVWLTAGAGRLPWIGLVLGITFGAYGLLRKIAALGALEGLAFETMLLAPLAIVAMAVWWRSSPTSFPGPDAATDLWLLGLGPATMVPLLLFSVAARRIPLVTLGLLQYLSPTIQFLIGVFLFGEPFTTTRLVGFAFIWAALALYTLDGWRSARRLAPASAASGP